MNTEPFSSRDLSVLLNRVKEVAVRASRLAYSVASPANHKPTTEIDRFINSELLYHLPTLLDVSILSEETGLSRSVDQLLWVIDPVDGTKNAIAHIPDFAVSIALVRNPGFEPLLGTVVAPLHGLVFSGAKGLGAFCNNQRLPLFTPQRDFPLVAVGLPEFAARHASSFGVYFGQLIQKGFSLRQSGSAALDICRTASGHWQAFHEFGVHLWDIAAADIIAKEADCRTLFTASRFATDNSESAYCIDYLACIDSATFEKISSVVA